MKARFTLLLVLVMFNAIAQQPVDNPYRTYYNITDPHWTDSLHWDHVINAREVPKLIDASGHVDSARLYQTMYALSNSGGGVFYFPKGSYYFRYNVRMPSGVIFRGADIAGEKNARSAAFRPPTKFLFPRYVPVHKGYGTPNYPAFRMFYTDSTPKHDIGLVNIDLNRARINFSQKFEHNVIVMGVRSNNAAKPVSTAWGQPAQEWQRYPDDWEANIILNPGTNAAVDNCRINDAITDDFDMPGFISNDGQVFKKDTVKFNYMLHMEVIFHADYEKPAQLEMRNNYVRSCKCMINVNADENKVKFADNDFDERECADLLDMNGLYSRATIKDMESKFSYHVYRSKEKDTLAYQLLTPVPYDSTKKYPLLVFYPGIFEGDNPLHHFCFIFTRPEMMKEHPYFVVAPYFKKRNIRENDLVVEVVKDLEKKYSIDTTELNIAGLSVGGNGLWYTMQDNPGMFKRALVMGSYKNLDEHQLEKMKGAHFYVCGGSLDTFIPIQYMRLMVARFKHAGIPADYFEYKTYHLSWINLSMDPRFFSLFFPKH